MMSSQSSHHLQYLSLQTINIMKSFLRSYSFLLLIGLCLLTACGEDEGVSPANTIPDEEVRLLFNGTINDDKGDVSGKVNNATLTTDRKGNANGAYNIIDKNSNINLGTNAKLSANKAFSMSTWIKPTKDVGTIFSKAGEFALELGAVKGICLGRDCEPTRSKTLRWMLKTSSGLTYRSANVTYSLDEWQHIVMTYDDGTTKLYLNNELVATQTNLKVSIGEFTVVPDFILGNKKDGALPLAGAMDEFRFYSRTLTEAEVAILYADK